MKNEKAHVAINILMADDDADDRAMTEDAFKENFLLNDLVFREDGKDLLDYLKKEGVYQDATHELPDLILLDLNMPRIDGREALKVIKNDPRLKHIPIVVLTTSDTYEDINKTYNLGANSFITKPVTFESFIEVTKTIGKYWFQVVKLPNTEENTD